jgi:hypothetical protein
MTVPRKLRIAGLETPKLSLISWPQPTEIQKPTNIGMDPHLPNAFRDLHPPNVDLVLIAHTICT